MKLRTRKLWFSIIFCSFNPIAPSITPSIAQIVPDATLPVNSTVTVSGKNSSIEGGTTAGSNLFHSFREFSVLTGNTAVFNNSADIQNIFTRVTGGSISNIDGELKANGAANLFLLNPNGIIFGPNASLDIGGSFLATTANAVDFGGGANFSATFARQNTPLLIVSVPLGLQYGQSSGSIVNRSTDGLQVRSGNSLILAGGDVRFDGGKILAPGGRVELAAVSAGETVGLNAFGNNVSLNFPAQIARANISLTNGADVNVRAGGGGDIVVNTHNLNFSEGSKLQAGIAEILGAPDALAGDINVNATGAITFDGVGNSDVPSGAYNLVTVEAVGEGGDINITAETLSLTNGAQVKASTLGEGNAGNVNIRIRNVSSFEGADTNGNLSGVYSRAEANEAVGNGGNINISTGSLFVTNGAVITASTQGRGNAGNVEIYVRNDTVLDGLGPLQEIIYASGEVLQFQQSSGLFSSVKRTGVGEGGNIRVTTGSLSIANGGVIVTRTEGQGRAGNITVNAADFVTVDGVGSDNSSSALLAPTEPGAGGRGGDITINTNIFRVSDGAVVNSQTQNEYLGGNITINSNIFEARGGGQAIATTRSSGQAGNLTVNAADKIVLSGSDHNFPDRASLFNTNIVGNNEGAASGLFASTGKDSAGAGGNLNIITGQLIVRDGAKVTVSADGKGAAGNLRVAADSIRLNNGTISATTQAGNFGNITLQTGNLQMRRNSQITTNASGTATGGNINIEAGAVAALENSDIRANAVRGQGGNIIITAEGVFQSLDSDIDASSELGIDGNVELRTPDTDPVKGLNQPEILGVPPAPAQTCQTRGQRTSRFVITGRGGLPPSPRERVSSEHNFEAVKQPIVEAQGWIINAKGEIELVANSAAVVPYSPGRAPVCH
ncbi:MULTISPECIES: two-partner secretion domain-containing protein [unclassified Microcoleus]|uniref:two-partner secretion domain-containing protein n=1 Tax=unclassified Microcoleus TaxID=2642155 RepID=UPI002FCEF31F